MYFVHKTFKLREIFGAAWYYLLHRKSLDRILHNRFKEMYGREGILVNFGRSAFEILIKKYNLENSEIIMPAYICGADNVFVNTMIKYNIKPAFVDAGLDDFNCDVDDIKKNISGKTKAIMAAYIYGSLFDVSELREICKKKKILLIENCAHCFGAKLGDGVKIFSLYKNMPNIGGGYLIGKDIDIYLEADKIKLSDVKLLMSLFVNTAIYKFVKFFKKAKVSEGFEGFSGAKEANALIKLLFCYYYPKFQKNFNKQAEIGDYMRERLKEKGIKVQNCKSVYSFFSLLVDNRKYVVDELRKKGILATETWFKPIVLNEKAIKAWKLNKKDYRNSVEISEKVINLPVHFYYSKKDVEYIVESLVQIKESSNSSPSLLLK